MSIRAIVDRRILLNITNMDERDSDIMVETTASGDKEIRETKGVQAGAITAAYPTPPAASPMLATTDVTNAAQSIGDGLDCRRRFGNTTLKKECLRSMHGRTGKLGSGEHEFYIVDDGGEETAAKKRKTRRGKPKHRKLKPYSKQSACYGATERMRCRAGAGRLRKRGGQPPAPYNTTQFLMEDHSDLPDLEQKLADAITSETLGSFQKPLAPPRTRDSSFSIDSEEDYFYSSPEDEEEFLTKEFSSAYEDLHAERLSTLTKSELIQEYVQLEAKLDILTKRLRGIKSFQQTEERRETSDDKNSSTTSARTTEAEMAKKLKIYQQRIDDLLQQNEQLRRDNEALRSGKHCASTVSSVDSESDSESSTNENPSSCSCEGSAGPSPTTGKSYRSRRQNRLSSTDTESDSDDTPSSHGDDEDEDDRNPDADDDPKTTVTHVNGYAANHEIGGLPT